jgi:hypothetical protein
VNSTEQFVANSPSHLVILLKAYSQAGVAIHNNHYFSFEKGLRNLWHKISIEMICLIESLFILAINQILIIFLLDLI